MQKKIESLNFWLQLKELYAVSVSVGLCFCSNDFLDIWREPKGSEIIKLFATDFLGSIQNKNFIASNESYLFTYSYFLEDNKTDEARKQRRDIREKFIDYMINRLKQ